MRVDLESFSLSYDGRAPAVDQLNLSIPSGSMFALIGPNGAGKSTSLKAIAGLLLPSAGRVLLDGVGLGDAAFAQRRRSIGFVGESLPFDRGVSSFDYLYFYARAHGLSRVDAKRRCEEVLTMLDLRDKASVACRALSKGMRQRLSVGRAWIHHPQLLILDEPADGLDPQGRSDLRKILRRIHCEQGATILISSHILRELDDLCDEMAILQAGQLAISGKVSEIQQRFATASNRYRLRAFVGQNQCTSSQFERLKLVLVECAAVIESVDFDETGFCVALNLPGGERASAELLRRSVSAGVGVSALERVGSRLEDVYEQLSNDIVN